MARFFKDNGLTVALMGLFLVSILGHWMAGWRFENEELKQHGQAGLTLFAYAASPQFLSTVFENWESEFLQMATYVVLTAVLFQKGSSESRDPDGPLRDDDLARQARKKGAPAILKAGAAARWLYAHSLGIVMLFLFAGSFLLHWMFSAEAAAGNALTHGQTPLPMSHYLTDPQLWFESFQNWQSEFLSTAVLVVLSIYLRQKESPESKPVAAPHSHTGD